MHSQRGHTERMELTRHSLRRLRDFSTGSGRRMIDNPHSNSARTKTRPVFHKDLPPAASLPTFICWILTLHWSDCSENARAVLPGESSTIVVTSMTCVS